MRKIYFVGAFVFTILVGCTMKTTSCDVKTLLLEESFFPGKVDSEPVYSPISDDAPPDSATRYIYVGYAGQNIYLGGVQQDIMNFGSSFRASNFVENRIRQAFVTNSSKGPWEMPKDAENLELSADESRLACGMAFGSKTCHWFARYKIYYLHLRADLSENGMTESVLVDAVKEIDSRMLQCLG